MGFGFMARSGAIHCHNRSFAGHAPSISRDESPIDDPTFPLNACREPSVGPRKYGRMPHGGSGPGSGVDPQAVEPIPTTRVDMRGKRYPDAVTLGVYLLLPVL